MNYIYFLSLSEELEKANQWLKDFTDNTLNSPWAGYVIFIVLIALGWAFIKGFADK